MPSVPSPRARAARRTAALAALVLLLTALGASPAAAHNTLRSTDPADGSTVATAPAQVTLTFDQPATELGTQVVVTGPDGAVLSAGAAQLVDASVVQPLVAELPAGTYTVDWRVTSADGHPLSGAFTFTATDAVGGAVPTADAAPTPEPSAEDVPADEPTEDAAVESTVTAVPTPAAPPPADGPSAGVWIAVGLGALAALGGGVIAAVVARRRARADGAPAADGAGPGPTTAE
ncbi:copper resistance CopC family protein [Cellulomonas wangsupingiae]|uniref:Copper resistance protein CopC n=1 Tax=Cellulomonas wangsupingiae TaxID=2968085 RepID=A0ABY5K574_9CELL|nr:copper resistance CopC family protein [Cellulomonas wangsupingiae]MCC2333672.1 copper resistance protein CopC [Cellulomonas wangsupingiae]UUI64938.1 copper resistance protein CopC [Cellulomonas wangsupingiae]